jgi:pimeloyl-ACP methyl ester carboxylesterase
MVEKRAVLSRGIIPYLESGKGPDLIFFHGLFAMPQAYTELLTLLSDKYHVIAPTHPGHGDSYCLPEAISGDVFIDAYREFISRLRIMPDIFIGHSFGGAIAIVLSQYFAEVKVLAMDAPAFPLPVSDIRRYLKAMADEGKAYLRRKPALDDLKSVTYASRTLFKTIARHPEDIHYFFRYAPLFDASEIYKKIETPVKLLWGEEDMIVRPEEGKKLHQLLKGSTLKIFPGLKHNYPVTDPEFTFREIIKIIGKPDINAEITSG